MTLSPERLRGVRTTSDVLTYLHEELDWPIDESSLDNATFDFSPEELGIPSEAVPKLASLRQLRPLETNQPWGIFFIEFNGPRLPLTYLRLLLGKLVARKRAVAGGSRTTWALADLLFIISTNAGDAVEIHFVAFRDEPGHEAEVLTVPWRPTQSPSRHLRRLTEELLPKLAWPDDPGDSSTWRESWRSAFRLRHGEAIASATRLAERMADAATQLRADIAVALGDEYGTGPFSSLLQDVQTQLLASLDEAKFADMCAQTLVYGVLTSRITDPVAFGASPVFATVPLANPFLAAFFDSVYEQASALDLEGSGLEQLVADLRASPVEAILDSFGSSAKGGDPVIHFYEEFLKRYDAKLRADAGAFYTPQAVVAFMVRTVDWLLRDRFGLRLGLADGATWRDVADLNKFAVPERVDPAASFVSMIDPATGTGTFLVEWLRQARASFLESEPKGDWPTHLRSVVLPAMHAFELMLGPYAIAHLKVALALHDEGVPDAATSILLTDTLDHESHAQRLALTTDPLSLEGQRAAELKDNARFTVCIGNPPYDRQQRDADAIGLRKGGVARYGSGAIPPLMANVLDPLKKAGLGKHAKNAYNDYVYFWTWALWQAVAKREGPGVVAFITASSYLDGVSLGGLRSHLRDVFDELWIVDLGGEGRGARLDENVFDILTPVTIAFGVRTGDTATGNCLVRYLRVAGARDEKLELLRRLDLSTAAAVPIVGDALSPLTPSTTGGYFDWPELTELIPWAHSGCQLKRTWPVGESKSTIERRWKELVTVVPAQRGPLMRETPDRNTKSVVSSFLRGGSLAALHSLDRDDAPDGVERYGYRSFDRQWLLADNRLADRPRPELWKVRGAKQVFFTTLTSTKLAAGPAITAAPYVPDLHHFRGSYGAKDVFPLYRDAAAKDPNLTQGLLAVLSEAVGRSIDAERFVAYVYGLTGTAAFAERFHEELGERAGPVRIPVTTDAALFGEVAEFGADLIWWHTWGERSGDGSLPPGSAIELAAITSYPEKYSYDAAPNQLVVGDGRFGPVSPEIYTYEVSGLKVVQSWLGNRMRSGKGKKSSALDEIRPSRWTFTPELLLMLSIIEHTVDVTPAAAALLDRVVGGALVDPTVLPGPTDAERKPPRS